MLNNVIFCVMIYNILLIQKKIGYLFNLYNDTCWIIDVMCSFFAESCPLRETAPFTAGETFAEKRKFR